MERKEKKRKQGNEARKKSKGKQVRSVNSVERGEHRAQWAHNSSESTVHTVGQCKPTDYLCEVEGAEALERRRSPGLGPVDAASKGELEIENMSA